MTHHDHVPSLFKRIAVLFAAVGLIALLMSGPDAIPVSAHNLQTKMVYMFTDAATQTLLDNRINGGWVPGTPLLLAGDEVGLIIKVVPRDGTTTGVGGHVDFYVPNGVTVEDVAYLAPDGLGGYNQVAMKGQSPIPVGAGPIGAKTTADLIGLGSLGPNINGVTEASVSGTGLHRGTIAGVYGDTGIFYSTDPDTSYGSWQRFTGDPETRCGISTLVPPPTGKTITNNSGDTVVPCNKWDAEQLFAWGAKGTTYSGAFLNGGLAIVDTPDQRGNAPWGHASGVAGPQSGYKWNFDWDEWAAAPIKNAAAKRGALENDEVGPWNRIRYAGSRISKDVAGSLLTTNGFANVDGSTVGVLASALPATHPTTGQTDTTSPKAIRWAVGQLTTNVPEFVYVKVKVDDPTAILDGTGCPVFHGDTFGGDAGGSDNGKDHLWRYYEPSEVTWNGCAGIGKPATRDVVKVGDNFQYKVKFYNLGTLTLTNVIVKDTLASGVTFLSSVPAQSSGPNPLVWNVGTLQPGQKFEAVVTVKATGSGLLDNCIIVDTAQLPDQKACETTYSGPLPLLAQTKSATPLTVSPGGTVQYTINIANNGTGPTGSPVTIDEYLPTGFTFVSKDLVTINGANVTLTTGVNTSSPYSTNQPRFTVPGAINAGQSLILKFTAQVPANTAPGRYCNTYTTTQNGIPATTGSAGCIEVVGGQIGDTIFRDWDGDGTQDVDEEGLPGVTVTLTGPGCAPCTTTTDANGQYLFSGLAAGNYTVSVPTPGSGGVPTGYTLTADPDGGAATTSFAKTLATGEVYLGADWGYQPGGTGSIGDTVFDDKNADGSFNGSDVGIPNVTVNLYEDSNGNGIIDVGSDALVATDFTDGSGVYSFGSLATGLKYLVDVDQTDPDIASYYVSNYGSSSGVVQTTTDPHNVMTLTGAYTAADFGFYKVVPGSIGDQVFVDADRDGLYDMGETLLPNITVRLYQSDGTTLLETTSTDINGVYTFGDLPAGTYVVKVDTTDTDLPAGLSASVSEIMATLAASQVRTDVDFPFVTILTKAVDLANANGGDTLTYTLTPSYTGSNALTNVTVTDVIPSGTTFSTAGQGGSNVPPVTWNLGSTTAASNGSTTISGNSPSTITYVASANASGSGTTLSPAMPTGTVQNDVMIAGFSWDGGSNRTINSVPSGWNLIRTTTTAATITYVAASTDSGQHSNPTAGIPAGTAAGDVLIAAVEISNGHARGTGGDFSAITPPADWTLIRRTDLSSGGFPWRSLLTYWRVATASTPVPTWTTDDGQEHWSVGIVAYRGVDTTSPIDAESAQTNASSTSVTAPSITTTAANTRLVGIFASSEDPPTGGTVPGTMTERVDVVRDDSDDTHVLIGDETFVGPGATGTRVATMAGSASLNIGALVALKPASLHGQAAYYKVAGASEAGPYNWGISASGKWTVGISTYRGVDTASPINADAAQANASSTSAVAPSITTTSANTRLVGVFASKNGTPVASPPGSMTERIDASTAAGGTSEAGLEMSDEAFVGPGSTGTRTATLTAATINIGHLIALKPGSTAWSYSVTTALAANRSLVTTGAGNTITVVMTVSATTVTGSPPFPITVTPGALNVTGTNSATAVFGAASPATRVLSSSGSTDTFTYTSTSVTPGSVPGVLTLRATPSDPNGSWAQGTANTVLATPLLTYQVTVDNAPAPSVVKNTAQIQSTSGIATSTSNEVTTVIGAGIGDFVWADLDGDGVQDVGEPGLNGVEVCVDNGGTPVCATTDANGKYLIGGLSAGTYSVNLTLSTVPAGYIPSTDTSLSVTLTSGQQYLLADFGLRPAGTASIGDTIWIDADEDGVVDGGESGISGVTVRLYRDVNNDNAIDAGDYIIAVDVTDASGNYLFDGLYGGSYIVDVDQTTLPGGVELVSPGGRTDPEDVDLVDGEDNLTIDFGYNYSGQIGDFAWYDKDGDQVQDGPPEPACADTGTNECGAPATTIVLYEDSNNNNAIDPGEPIVAVTVTDADGYYLFDNLPPGNYVVRADTQQVPAPATSANAGQVGLMNSTTGSSKAVDLTVGNMTNYTADFGFIEGAKVEGHVFHDINHNGLFDSGETPLPNVTVTLTGTDLSGNPVSLSTTTNASGEYKFLVPPGTYTIAYDTMDPDIPANLTDPTTVLEFASFTVAPGAEYQDLDFGRDDPGKIGDRVWKDDDGDGVQDAGETGLGGITVRLYQDNDNSGTVTGGDIILATQSTTAGTGAYLFEGLPVGGSANYVVQIESATVPAGYVQTGDPDQPGVTCTTCDLVGNADLPTAAPLLTVDFGFQPAPISVSGNIWKDIDGDGVDDGAGEPGIPGVTVNVLIDTDGDGITDLTLTAVTDGNGDYSVTGVPSGSNVTIKVDETTLPNDAYVQTGDEDEVGTCTICDAMTMLTNVTTNQTGKDFGYDEVLGSISGTVVENADGDGLAEGGETPVSGVTVILTDAGPDNIIGTSDDVVYTDVTDGNGDYSFPNLTPGVYEITKINPAGKDSLADRDGGNPNSIGVALTLGEVEIDQDFELQGRGVIGNDVWIDVDQDGVRDAGEPGIPSVTVRLYRDVNNTPGNLLDDTLIGTTTTDADGHYLFTDVPAGVNYYVDADSADPNFPSGLVLTNGRTDPTPMFNLAAGQTYLDADIGYTSPAPTAIIGDFVWSDADGDGIQDPGEPGIAGVGLTLKGPGPDGILGTGDDTNVATATTDGSGRYLFTGVAAGEYRVDVTTPPAGTLTVGPQSRTDPTAPILVAPGDVYLNADFGYQNPALFTITDVVWLDADGDAVKDVGENGIPGVTVNLVGAGADNVFGTNDDVVIATTTTTSTGAVIFTGVPNGDYRIVPEDVNDVLDELGPTTAPALAGYQPVTVAGANVTGVNFGYNSPVSVGDTVFSDADGDGTQDAGESGIPNVLVQIWRDANNDNVFDSAVDTLITTATTDGSGQYLVSGLPIGTYFASVDNGQAALTGYAPTTTDQEVGVNAAGTQIEADLPNGGTSFLGADFGYQKAANPNVSGSVWHDLDRDGKDDGAGEPPIPGVTVDLVDSNGNVVATTTTDTNGNYSFPDVPPGSYEVVVTDTAGVLIGYDLTGGIDPWPITVAATDITGIDFGYARSPETGAIGDRVWLDADRDGVQDGAEAGLPNVTLRLYRDNGDGVFNAGTDTLVETTVSGLDGGYIFDGLPAGNYFVDVDQTTLPAGLTTTPGTTDPSAMVNLSEGEHYPDADFGYGPTSGSALGDRVWYDYDGDGIQDPGEPGIGGVTVTVYGPGCNPCTVVTDPDGLWLVTGLAPGSYTVAVNPATLPAGYGPDPTNGPISRPALVLAGSDNLTLDFGFNGGTVGSIGDKVFFDSDGDGILDAGEPGIPNVSLNLIGPGTDNTFGTPDDVVLATTVTNANGDYDFVGLPAGNYRVAVTDVDQVLTGLNLSAGTNPTGTIALGAGQDYNDADFPYAPTAGAIGNQIWHDLDGDGVRDTGEPGIEGVAVDLWQDIDGDGVIDPAVDNLIRSTTTDINGRYEFLGLGATKYLVDVTAANTAAGAVLEGFVKTSGAANINDNSQADPFPVELTALVLQSFNADFGYTAPGAGFSLSGKVFDDVNNNGGAVPTDEAGTDTPVAGATVYLYRDLDNDGVIDPTDPLLGTAVTDANGDYSFTDLPDGNYLLVSDATSTRVNGYTQTTQIPTDAVEPATISGANVIDQDFGYHLPSLSSSIGSRVWLDENSDGIQDPGEAGLPNVVVELWNATHTTLLATTVTDADGNYRFGNLTAGTYQVDLDTATLPSGLAQTPLANPGADYGNQDFSDNDMGGPDADGYPVVLGARDENLTADFGFNWGVANNPPAAAKGAIGDRVWVDADGDGAQDPGEPGLGGVTVTIYHDPDQDGIYDTPFTAARDQNGVTGTGTTVTEPDGSYVFYDLPAGGYVIAVTAPVGYTQTGDPDHFGTSAGTNDNRTTMPVAVAPGDAFVNADFGYQPTVNDGALDGSIGDTVWFDADADGVIDGGESGIPGVTVLLARDLDNDGVVDPGEVIATTTTDGAGQYLFDGLPAGNYLVQVDDAAGVLQGKTPSYDADGIGTPNLADVTLAAGEDKLDQDFGYTAPGQTPATALIGDRVWVDADNDGVQDAGEAGLEGAKVTLYDSTGMVELASAITDENGNYAFGGLAAGTYVVKVTQPSGMTQTFDADGLGSANQSTVTVAAGEIKLDQDFGYRGLGAIDGEIWKDTDADGTRDAGETIGYPGVTVAVYWDLDGDGQVDPNEPVVGQAVTDANGNYSISGLPTDDGGGNAKFLVVVTDDAGKLDGTWHTLGGAPGSEDNSQPTVYSVTLTPGSPTNSTADFGYSIDPGAVGNFVWSDLDGDGVQDMGEPGLGGVKVTLTISYPNGDVATLVTVSAADGSYSFGNLLLDEDFDGSGGGEPTFNVTFTTPAGYTPSPTGAGTTFTDNNWNGSTPIPAQPLEGVTDMALTNMTDTAASYDAGFTPVADWGDLPDSYSTQLADNGPRHVPGTLSLGTLAGDIDPNGQASIAADGDGADEDGVVRDSTTKWQPNQTVNINVVVTGGTGTLGLWLDLDANGMFESDEFFAFPNLTAGPHTIMVTLPNDYVTGTMVAARARLFDPAQLPGGTLDAGDYAGPAQNGEVEDYLWGFGPLAVSINQLTAKATGSGTTVPLLALLALAIGAVAVTAAARRTESQAAGAGSTGRVAQQPVTRKSYAAPRIVQESSLDPSAGAPQSVLGDPDPRNGYGGERS